MIIETDMNLEGYTIRYWEIGVDFSAIEYDSARKNLIAAIEGGKPIVGCIVDITKGFNITGQPFSWFTTIANGKQLVPTVVIGAGRVVETILQAGTKAYPGINIASVSYPELAKPTMLHMLGKRLVFKESYQLEGKEVLRLTCIGNLSNEDLSLELAKVPSTTQAIVIAFVPATSRGINWLNVIKEANLNLPVLLIADNTELKLATKPANIVVTSDKNLLNALRNLVSS